MPNASKIVINGSTKIDLTSDTVTASVLMRNYTAHNSAGEIINGQLDVVTYYTGSSDPSASLGSNGDIYLKS